MRSINNSMGKKVKCEKCNEQFSTKRALNQHVDELCSDEARKKKGYDCEYCAAGPFKVKRYITAHYKTCEQNPNRGDSMQCTICEEEMVHFVWLKQT